MGNQLASAAGGGGAISDLPSYLLDINKNERDYVFQSGLGGKQTV